MFNQSWVCGKIQCLVVLAVAMACAGYAATPVKVAVFKTGFGAQAVHDALKNDERIQAKLIKAITADALMEFDVLYIGSCSIEQPDQVRGIKTFAACGGGVVFNHTSCGRFRPATLFPDIAAKVLDRRDDSVLLVKDAAHPLTAGLPAEFTHAFQDHLYLQPGPAGVVVLADREGAAVAVAGAAGAGRVVFNGALPGYWYDPTDYAQAEKAPTGAELQWVVNSMLWAAGDPRLTQVPAAELAARRKTADTDIKLDELAQFLPNADWFGEEMLRGSYLPLPPVTEIGGRFFITYDNMSWRRNDPGSDPARRQFFLERLKIDVLQLKWMGITDIIYWTDMSGERVNRPTRVPDSVIKHTNIDPLAELIRLATPEGLNVWAAWHSCSSSKDYAEKYCARDGDGKFYMYGGKKYVEDLVNPAYLDRCRQMLDEYADIYKPMGNFKGLFTLDELWFGYADFHGDDLPVLEKFCVDNFGEKLPADFSARLEQRTRWNDPQDPWRRRYILFKQKVMTDFFRDLLQHAHKRGLEMGVTTIYIPGKWSFGMDNLALSRLGADYIIGGTRGYPNSIQWTHIYDTWGNYTTRNMLGGPGGLMFTFNHVWRLIMFGNDPRYARHFADHIYTMRMFADSENLTRVAFMENQQALEMLAPDPAPPWNRQGALIKSVLRHQPAGRILSQSVELYDNYRALVAGPFAGRALPADVMQSLRRYLEQGGRLVSIDADWSTARADMENERDCTAELLGVSYGAAAPAAPVSMQWGDHAIALSKDTPRRAVSITGDVKVLAAFGDGAPAVTELAVGAGKVIALHFDAGAELAQGGNQPLQEAFNGLLREAAAPPVTMECAGPAELRTVLKKGNWVAMALFPEPPPVPVNVKIDVAALGLDPAKNFRVLLMGRRMELARPGDLWGESGFWTAADLRAGVKLTLVEDQRRYLPLPEEFDLSDFTGKKGEASAKYCDNITRAWWDSEKRGKRKRDYAHEVLVIAPADEPVMPRSDTKKSI